MSDRNLQLYEYDERNELSKTALETKSALDKIVSHKLHNDKVTTLSSKSTNNDTTFVRYKSSQLANLSNTDENVVLRPRERIIKITDEKVDPMLPNAFRIRKAPPGPEVDGIVPVMHDETNTEKLTRTDQKKWQIGPSVSNWKNTKGFIIGIENRLQNTSTTNKMSDEDIEKSTKRFTSLSDALKNAEQKAKQDLKARASWRKREETREISETQQRLEKLAEEARASRKLEKISTITASSDPNLQEVSALSSEQLDKLQRRAERRRRAEEELKLDKISTKQKVRKLAREQGRDVSERVVLGVSEALKKKHNAGLYDSELYLRTSTSTATSNKEDLYDKPLFSQDAALKDVYRSRNISGGYKGLGSKDNTDNHLSSVKFIKDSESNEEHKD